MVLIQGEQPGDIWHGKVLSIDRARHIVDVYFFIEKRCEPHKFVRETFGRAARNSVAFDIQYLQLHLVHGLVQIAGKKQFDPFSQCTFSYPNYINSLILHMYSVHVSQGRE